jgi:hypothetical protein
MTSSSCEQSESESDPHGREFLHSSEPTPPFACKRSKALTEVQLVQAEPGSSCSRRQRIDQWRWRICAGVLCLEPGIGGAESCRLPGKSLLAALLTFHFR